MRRSGKLIWALVRASQQEFDGTVEHRYRAVVARIVIPGESLPEVVRVLLDADKKQAAPHPIGAHGLLQ